MFNTVTLKIHGFNFHHNQSPFLPVFREYLSNSEFPVAWCASSLHRVITSFPLVFSFSLGGTLFASETHRFNFLHLQSISFYFLFFLSNSAFPIAWCASSLFRKITLGLPSLAFLPMVSIFYTSNPLFFYLLFFFSNSEFPVAGCHSLLLRSIFLNADLLSFSLLLLLSFQKHSFHKTLCPIILYICSSDRVYFALAFCVMLYIHPSPLCLFFVSTDHRHFTHHHRSYMRLFSHLSNLFILFLSRIHFLYPHRS